MKKAIVAFLLSVTTLGVFAQDITLRRPPAKLGVDVLDAIRSRTASRAFVRKTFLSRTFRRLSGQATA
jgi:hypothetical protein